MFSIIPVLGKMGSIFVRILIHFAFELISVILVQSISLLGLCFREGLLLLSIFLAFWAAATRFYFFPPGAQRAPPPNLKWLST